VIIPCFLSASVVKLARASANSSQPIVCDGIDDHVDTFVVYGLADDTVKKASLRNARDLAGRTMACSELTRTRSAQLEAHPQPFSDSPRRSKRMLTQRTLRPDDPDAAH